MADVILSNRKSIGVISLGEVVNLSTVYDGVNKTVVNLTPEQARSLAAALRAEAGELDEINLLRAQVNDLKISVIAFGGPQAVRFANDAGLPAGHLNPVHYDILARAGARMDDFIRGDEPHAE